MASMDWSSASIAITGASSGIGAATALEVARRGAGVALCARRKDRLEKVAARCREAGARDVVVRTADVGVYKDLTTFASVARDTLGDATVVIANAGFGSFGNTLDLPPSGIEQLVRTNLVGAIWTLQAFGPQLQATRGHAIVVGSVVSKVAVPYGSVYAGTKWGLRGWTRGARPELERRGIKLTLFNPGYVRSEFFQHRLTAQGAKLWDPGRGFTPEKAARRMVRAIRRRPAEMEMSFLSRVAIPLYRLFPISSPRMMARVVRNRLRKP